MTILLRLYPYSPVKQEPPASREPRPPLISSNHPQYFFTVTSDPQARSRHRCGLADRSHPRFGGLMCLKRDRHKVSVSDLRTLEKEHLVSLTSTRLDTNIRCRQYIDLGPGHGFHMMERRLPRATDNRISGMGYKPRW